MTQVIRFVDDFINRWNTDFNTLHREKLYELFPFNNGVSPTSCTLFARSIFYAMYNNTDPNGDDNIEDIFITADTSDLRRVLNENNIFEIITILLNNINLFLILF